MANLYNIYRPDSSGILAAQAMANKAMVGAGDRLSKRFSDYGDRLTQENTDIAVNALRAAAPDDRAALMQEFSDSGMSMDSKQIGAAADKLSSEARLVTGQEIAQTGAEATSKYREDTLGLKREQFQYKKKTEEDIKKQNEAFAKSLSMPVSSASDPGKKINGGKSIADNNAFLTAKLKDAKTAEQRSFLNATIAGNEADGERIFNDYRMQASSEGYDIGGLVGDARNVSRATGVPLGDVLKESPMLVNSYIYNEMTTGDALVETQNLNNALGKVEAAIASGDSDAVAQAQAEMTTVRTNINSAVKGVQDRIIRNNIDATTMGKFMESNTNPYGSLMKKASSLESELAKIGSDTKKANRAQADAITDAVKKRTAKHTQESITVDLINKFPGQEYEEEIDAVQTKSNVIIQDAPGLLKGDNKWALVESLKDLTRVGEGWFGTERKWMPDADDVYRLALSKLGTDPVLVGKAAVSSEAIQKEMDKIK